MTDDKVTDIAEAKAKRNPGNYIFCCPDCGCGQFWVYIDFVLECVNCEAMMEVSNEEA